MGNAHTNARPRAGMKVDQWLDQWGPGAEPRPPEAGVGKSHPKKPQMGDKIDPIDIPILAQ